MYFRVAGRAIGESNRRKPLALTPPAWTVDLPQALKFPDSPANRDGLLIANSSQDLEVAQEGASITSRDQQST